jgi:hypothetical protein
MTREQALDELLRVEVELRTLQARRADLRQIVLSQQFEYSAAHMTHANGGPKRQYAARGTLMTRVIEVMRAQTTPLTVREIRQQVGEEHTYTNYGRTLERLRQQGLVNGDKSRKPFQWTLAVHLEPTWGRTDKGATNR